MEATEATRKASPDLIDESNLLGSVIRLAWPVVVQQVSFSMVQLVDTALVGWGPEAYNKVVRAYHNPIVHLLELGLVLALLYHALNGLKITLIDFFPRLARHIRPIGRATAALFVLAAIPTAAIMLKQTYDLWRA